jgi:hypothetical protein
MGGWPDSQKAGQVGLARNKISSASWTIQLYERSLAAGGRCGADLQHEAKRVVKVCDDSVVQGIRGGHFSAPAARPNGGATRLNDPGACNIRFKLNLTLI